MRDDRARKQKKLDGRIILGKDVYELIEPMRGEWDPEQLVPELSARIKRNDLLADSLADDYARFLIRDSISARKKVEFPSQLSLWTWESMNDGVIALNRGIVVKHRDATLLHVEKRLENQLENESRVVASRMKTEMLLQEIRPLMRDRPNITLSELAIDLGYLRGADAA